MGLKLDKRGYRGLLAALATLVAFAIYSHHTLESSSAPSVRLGGQAYQSAFTGTELRLQTGTQADDASNDRFRVTTFYDPSVYEPDLPNPTPLTELDAKSCIWPPSVWDICSIDSTPREDASRGPWVRIDRDIDRRTGIYYNYLFYRRKPAYSTLPVIVDIKLLTLAEALLSPTREQLESGNWVMAKGNLRAGTWPRSSPLFAWYLLAPHEAEPDREPFTELEIVYGLAGPRTGWESIGTISAIEGKTRVSLIGRRRPVPPVPKPELRFSTEGNFTILQLADFHFSTEMGKCRDTINDTACPPEKDADTSSTTFLNQAIDQVKPDFIMLSGDQINGQGTSWSARSAILKVSRIFQNRTIPWAAVFGNHDDEESDATRREQMSFMSTLPYFIGSAGPDTVDGVGNYLLKIRSADPSRTHLFSVYALDSHAYANTLFSSGYDWIKDSQIRWYKAESANVSMLLRPYQPPDLSPEEGMFGIGDGFRSLISGRVRRQVPGQILKKPNAMVFFHIPLPEMDSDTGLALDLDPVNRAPLIIGEALETAQGGPKHNSGFFSALTSVSEIGSKEESEYSSSGTALAASKAQLDAALSEVKVTAHGHQHVRASCERRSGIWSCFAGGSTYSGYGRTYFDRRVRVFHVSQYGERLETYQLVDSSAIGTAEDHRVGPNAAASGSGVGKQDVEGAAEAEEAAMEAAVEEEIIEELETEGALEVEPAHSPPIRRQDAAHPLKMVDYGVLVGPGAIGF